MTDTNTQPDIQAVIFDMGRVLVDIDSKLLVEKLFKGLDASDLQELGRKTMAHPAMVKFNTGRMDAQTFHRRMCESYGLELSFEAFTSLWCAIFVTMKGMRELLEKIAPRITIGLLSDTDPVHWSFIRRRWAWIDAIEKPTLSFEVGVMKPQAGIYLAAAENVNAPPDRCLFVDDLEVNVEGARAVGMQGARFETVELLTDQLTELGLLI
ncbi:MAG: HAD family hydrolase [Planctomycetota bacterium]|jgi:putative hydrolase of the HAD superfamily